MEGVDAESEEGAVLLVGGYDQGVLGELEVGDGASRNFEIWSQNFDFVANFSDFTFLRHQKEVKPVALGVLLPKGDISPTKIRTGHAGQVIDLFLEVDFG